MRKSFRTYLNLCPIRQSLYWLGSMSHEKDATENDLSERKIHPSTWSCNFFFSFCCPAADRLASCRRQWLKFSITVNSWERNWPTHYTARMSLSSKNSPQILSLLTSSSNQQYTMSSILESWRAIPPFWHLFSTFAKTYGNAICIAYRTARMATRVACSAIPVSTAVCHPSGIVSFSPLAFCFTKQIMAPRQGKQGPVHNHRHLYDQLDYGPVCFREL